MNGVGLGEQVRHGTGHHGRVLSRMAQGLTKHRVAGVGGRVWDCVCQCGAASRTDRPQGKSAEVHRDHQPHSDRGLFRRCAGTYTVDGPPTGKGRRPTRTHTAPTSRRKRCGR